MGDPVAYKLPLRLTSDGHLSFLGPEGWTLLALVGDLGTPTTVNGYGPGEVTTAQVFSGFSISQPSAHTVSIDGSTPGDGGGTVVAARANLTGSTNILNWGTAGGHANTDGYVLTIADGNGQHISVLPGITLGSDVSLSFASSPNSGTGGETFLSRIGVHTLGIGTALGGTDASIQLANLIASGTISGNGVCRRISADATAVVSGTAPDDFIEVDLSGGAVTFTIPTLGLPIGQKRSFTLVDYTSSAATNALTVQENNSGETLTMDTAGATIVVTVAKFSTGYHTTNFVASN